MTVRLADGRADRGGSGGDIAQRERQYRTTTLGQHARVARGLGLDELPEGERPSGDSQILPLVVLGSDLQEDADRGATLVELPGRVKEPRSPSEGGRPLR